MIKIDPTDLKSLRTIFRAASKRHVSFVVLAIAVATAATVGGPVVFGFMIDGLSVGSLPVPALLFCCYALFVGGSRFLNDISFKIVEFIELDVVHHAGVHLFESVLKKKASISHQYQSGFMVDAVRNMQESYGVYVFLVFSTLFPSIVETIVAGFVVAAVINWQIGLLVFVYASAIVVLTYISNLRAEAKQEQAVTALANSAEVLGEAIGSFQIIKVAQGGAWFTQIYRTLREEGRLNRRQFHHIRLKFALARSLTFALQLGLMYFVSVRLYQSGEISIGQIVIFNGLILQLNRPAEMIARAMEDLLLARQLQNGYNQILDYPEFSPTTENSSLSVSENSTTRSGVIEFKGVSFKYDDGGPILLDLDVRFQKGRMNFIVGPSGAGKTTLLRLMLRFVEGYKGNILLLGREVTSYSEPELFSTVGYVPQIPEILAASLADNVRLGANADTHVIRQTLQAVGLDPLIERLPRGIETKIGKRGVALSGGEMQRVAIARAILLHPKVLLLDEPSSALDAETERNIFDHLRALQDDMIIIAITHRRTMIEEGDFVLAFDDIPRQDRTEQALEIGRHHGQLQ